MKYLKTYKELNESLKTDLEIEMDDLLDKGIENLTPDEIDFLKNPYKKEEKEFKKQEILKYYQIADNFFKRILSTDVRNYDLDDKIDLFDILHNDDEVHEVVNSIYYMYGVQIDPENNSDFKLLNIFKRISDKIRK
jgi:hypothetical protein